jgi:hypothetical protein
MKCGRCCPNIPGMKTPEARSEIVDKLSVDDIINFGNIWEKST